MVWGGGRSFSMGQFVFLHPSLLLQLQLPYSLAQQAEKITWIELEKKNHVSVASSILKVELQNYFSCPTMTSTIFPIWKQ